MQIQSSPAQLSSPCSSIQSALHSSGRRPFHKEWLADWQLHWQQNCMKLCMSSPPWGSPHLQRCHCPPPWWLPIDKGVESLPPQRSISPRAAAATARHWGIPAPPAARHQRRAHLLPGRFGPCHASPERAMMCKEKHRKTRDISWYSWYLCNEIHGSNEFYWCSCYVVDYSLPASKQ